MPLNAGFAKEVRKDAENYKPIIYWKSKRYWTRMVEMPESNLGAMVEEYIDKKNGLQVKHCRPLDGDETKGFICENEKVRMTCRFRGKQNEDGSIDGGMDCNYKEKTD